MVVPYSMSPNYLQSLLTPWIFQSHGILALIYQKEMSQNIGITFYQTKSRELQF